jgi:hypothetical protein
MNKVACWISLILIIILGLIIINSSIDNKPFETFANDTEKKDVLENRVKILEEKVNGIKSTSDKNSNISDRINKLYENAELAKNAIDTFMNNNKERYKDMYLWYAKLTGNDPEEVQKEIDSKVKNNEQKFKELEEDMIKKYNKK